MQRIHLIAVLAVLGIAGIAGIWLGSPATEPPPVTIHRSNTPELPETAEPQAITVHVAGAVRSPGLVTLLVGDRVAQAVEAAGGALAVADLSVLNLAAGLQDGDQVTVPVRGEQPARGVGSDRADDGLVDLNHASSTQLEALPGVGPVLARRIFDYRQEHGPFATVEDLLDVPGIGEAKLAALREALILR